jgi:GTP-binding protein
MLPLVSIVGRPNVGKSTLVNRLISSREAIVQSEPGVTRDRNYYETEWRRRRFNLIDTGGLDPGTSDALAAKMGQQAIYAVEESDVVLLLVDAADGLTPPDEEVVEILRGMNKEIILVVNKVDNTRREDALVADFHRTGFSRIVPISALHGLGVGELLDEVVASLPEKTEEEDAEEEGEKPLTIAIVGRPNVGKSSLFNKLIGQDRSLIYEKPGTTRDSVDTRVEIDGEPVVFVDTAGWRRQARVDNQVEYFSIVRLWRTLDRADVALLVIDATEGVTDQDQKIAARIRDDGLASLIILNKWDLAREDERARELVEDAQEDLHFIAYSPILRISALTGSGLKKIMPEVKRAHANWQKRIQTSHLNQLKEEIILRTPPPSKKGRQLQIYYITQARTEPPEFVFFVNDRELARSEFTRFLERRIREMFDFAGSPVRVILKGKKKRT